MAQDVLAGITAAVAALDERQGIALVKEALDNGESSVRIVRAAQEGMQIVGLRYEQQDIFLAGLIMGGEIFRGVMELVQPGLENELVGDASGHVLLGTVAGDIHDIGKNMAALAFRMFGFTVEDLGINVPPERFLEAVKAVSPDIVGMSGLLSVAFTSMRDTVSLLRSHADELARVPVIIVGGGTIDEVAARYIGADHWTTDAMEGVRICQSLMERAGRPAAG
ncbi:MAG: cobalamin-dependent protein [Thermoleophilia bacterium]|nr:cobalamin-dependent protein [Thermoleophilia bacterium]